MEQRVVLPCGRVSLEGLLDDQSGERAVVVTHPHPLYGGDMHNNVVVAVVQAYRAAGYSTLRLNFRGVGASSGTYDGGAGEQQDVQAGLAELHRGGKRSVELVGYSFGAWVVARGLERYQQAERVVLIAPPISMLDFGHIEPSDKIKLVVIGADDALADHRTVQQLLQAWNPAASLRVVPGADHFFWRHTPALQAILREFLQIDSS